MSVVIFIIILAVLIFVHELGHFLVAKKAGIRVDEFGLGFPPKIFAKKWGETTYTLNAIPFGGFVKIFGEDPHEGEINEEDKPRNFLFKPKWVQASVLVAGVTFNLIFAWLCISLGFMIGLPAFMDLNVSENSSKINSMYVEVLDGSPAQLAGLVSGDKITQLSSGQNIVEGTNLVPENVRKIINESDGEVRVVRMNSVGEIKEYSVKPEYNAELGIKVIGIAMGNQIIKLPVHLAFIEGVRTTWLLIKNTTIGLLGFLSDVVTFKSDFSQVAGPVGIASIVSQANSSGFIYLLFLVALISINLAIINLLPFPALDGGRLLFVLIEAIIGRPINPVFVRWTNAAGFVLLLILMVVITGHDILKLI